MAEEADRPATPLAAARLWFDRVALDLARQMRWSFLPPLMVYAAAGISGLTAIVGAFFVKDYLGLSAAFVASLGFWAGLPWALKMPLGHVVDLIWARKAALVWLGAGLVALSLVIMWALIARTDGMAALAPVSAWFVAAALLAPTGYALQDVVADAMTVEAVPTIHPDGTPLAEAESRALHTTMQTLGRVAVIGGSVLVAALNLYMFDGVEGLDEGGKRDVYARIYLMALAIPALSVSGVTIGALGLRRRAARLRAAGRTEAEIARALSAPAAQAEPDWPLLGGALAFAAISVGLGLSDLPFAQEAVFAGSMAVLLFLMARLMRELPPEAARALVGTAIIVFAFRAVPLPGPGLTWFEIDVLGFDERFLSVLSLVTAGLTLFGMIVLRPMMASRSIAWIVVMLSLASGVLALPNIGLYYGVQAWTAAMTGGVVDARFIAILDTAVESPLGQIAMIPMLAWIARSAPAHLKATFFAVMASFTNLALSASSLATKHLNTLFVVEREVTDRGTGQVATPADYTELGLLLIAVAAIGMAVPLATVLAVQMSRFRTES